MSIEKVAIPSEVEAGLDGPLSGHFGHCPYFILATVENGEIKNVESLQNLPHTSCAGPVNLLAENGVNVLLTSGMGMRPYMICQQLGITVAQAIGASVQEALSNYINGTSPVLGKEGLCRGGRAHK